jgi:hypothetical protein
MPELSKLTPVVENLWVTVDNLCFSVGSVGVSSSTSSLTEAAVKLGKILHTFVHSCREGK